MKATYAWDLNPWVWALTFTIAEGPLSEGRRERPILFRGELVRAILEGRKTQTRRPVKPQPVRLPDWSCEGIDGYRFKTVTVAENLIADPPQIPNVLVECPYGQPGDRLWCKETHALLEYPPWPDLPHAKSPASVGSWFAYYRAGFDRSHSFRWRPSIHMPRWASRLSLEIVSVRVERLHAISEEDARAEGVEPVEESGPGMSLPEYAPHRPVLSYRAGFERVWRTVHDQQKRRGLAIARAA